MGCKRCQRYWWGYWILVWPLDINKFDHVSIFFFHVNCSNIVSKYIMPLYMHVWHIISLSFKYKLEQNIPYLSSVTCCILVVFSGFSTNKSCVKHHRFPTSLQMGRIEISSLTTIETEYLCICKFGYHTIAALIVLLYK
jgi:hypothetical protein